MAKKNSSSRRARVLSSKVVYRGPVFSVTTDIVKEPGCDTPQRRDMVRHQGSVVILLVDDSGREPRVLLARQYRHAAGKNLWELPAGRIDHGESELAAAKRELREETGYTARHWKRALFFYSSPGFLDETMAIYLAQGITRGAAQPEEDEVISKRFFPLPAALRMALNQKITDAKTIAGILWLDTVLRDGRRTPRSGWASVPKSAPARPGYQLDNTAESRENSSQSTNPGPGRPDSRSERFPVSPSLTGVTNLIEATAREERSGPLWPRKAPEFREECKWLV